MEAHPKRRNGNVKKSIYPGEFCIASLSNGGPNFDCFELPVPMVQPHVLRPGVIWLYRGGQTVDSIARLLKMHRGTVWKTVKRFQAQGSLEDRPRAGRPPTATARRVVEAVRARIRRNPRLSQAKAAPELGISRRSFGRIVKDRLGMRPYKHVARQQLTALQKAKRLERCKTLLRFLKSGRHLVTVWSDEKLFPSKSMGRNRCRLSA